MVKDTLERATEPNLNLKTYLQDAYIHPVFKGSQLDIPVAIDEEENNPLVPTKRTSRQSSIHSFGVSSEADLWDIRKESYSHSISTGILIIFFQ